MASLTKKRARSAIKDYTKPYGSDEESTRTEYASAPKKGEKYTGPSSKEEDSEEDEGTDEPADVDGLAEEKEKPSEDRGTASRIVSALAGGLSQWSQDERSNRKSKRDLNNARMKS